MLVRWREGMLLLANLKDLLIFHARELKLDSMGNGDHHKCLRRQATQSSCALLFRFGLRFLQILFFLNEPFIFGVCINKSAPIINVYLNELLQNEHTSQ